MNPDEQMDPTPALSPLEGERGNHRHCFCEGSGNNLTGPEESAGGFEAFH